ncbi:MAG: hypothetical protein J6T86_09490 [Bacteroidales bacterium]|nr:hypothetical protein [Bacteroidales bacterium]
MSLLAEHSLWLIPVAIALGVGYALFLYFRNHNIEFEKGHRIAMASLRGLAVTLMALLLMSPMLKRTVKETDKPVVIVAVDNSESLRAAPDSSFYLKDYAARVGELIADIGSQYEVKTYLVGDENRLTPENEALQIPLNDKSTNLSSLFEEMEMLYANRNVGAVVMLSDGIYNTGANPYYRAEKVKYPVYTVGLGSPELSTDLLIAGVDYNKQALKGNFFPVEIKVAANKLAGKRAELTVSENGNTILTKSIQISGKQHFETVKLSIEAKNSGLHGYTIDLTELDGEVTYKNNHTKFYVEVIEQRDKIAIVYQSPHPDVAAIKEALEQTDSYEVTVSSIDQFNGTPSDYSLFILHQLPAIGQSAANLLTQIRKGGISTLYILGPKSDLNSFSGLNSGVSITQSKALTNQAVPVYNENFTSFSFSEETRQLMGRFPPVKTVFGTYKTAVSANVFLYQKVSGVDTKYPLIAFNENSGVRTGVITGSGIWQWKLYNFMYKENHDAFNEIINKTALYLASRTDKSQFRVQHAQVFRENSDVEFTAELYNDSYELINEPDVKMSIKGHGDTTYEAQFSKQNNGYYLNVGELPTGTYQWTATTQSGNKKFSKSGQFTVQEVMLETANLIADHDLLKSISTATNGQFFTRDQMKEVAKAIKANENIKTIATYKKRYKMLLSSPWYLGAILLLLGVEWFLRKLNGGY